MISNPKGWSDRRTAALARKVSADRRAEINAQRWRVFSGEAEPADIDEVEKIKSDLEALAAEVQANTDAIVEAVTAIDPENLENAELREALEAKGFEVPKNTARARLIELYNEKVA